MPDNQAKEQWPKWTGEGGVEYGWVVQEWGSVGGCCHAPDGLFISSNGAGDSWTPRAALDVLTEFCRRRLTGIGDTAPRCWECAGYIPREAKPARDRHRSSCSRHLSNRARGDETLDEQVLPLPDPSPLIIIAPSGCYVKEINREAGTYTVKRIAGNQPPTDTKGGDAECQRSQPRPTTCSEAADSTSAKAPNLAERFEEFQRLVAECLKAEAPRATFTADICRGTMLALIDFGHGPRHELRCGTGQLTQKARRTIACHVFEMCGAAARELLRGPTPTETHRQPPRLFARRWGPAIPGERTGE